MSQPPERILKALANRRRLAILKALEKHELSVSEISRSIKLSFRATSKHLCILANSDILDRRQESLNVYHRLSDHMPNVARVVLASVYSRE